MPKLKRFISAHKFWPLLWGVPKGIRQHFFEKTGREWGCCYFLSADGPYESLKCHATNWSLITCRSCSLPVQCWWQMKQIQVGGASFAYSQILPAWNFRAQHQNFLWNQKPAENSCLSALWSWHQCSFVQSCSILEADAFTTAPSPDFYLTRLWRFAKWYCWFHSATTFLGSIHS